MAVFEFHHVTGRKDFNIGSVANKSWSVIRKELKKCKLVCSNCHRIAHCTRDDARLIDEYFRYEGKLFRTLS
jgi:predicted HNH restriction endonuclease